MIVIVIHQSAMNDRIYDPELNRTVLRKILLTEEGNGSVYSEMTLERRLALVWPLTLSAWQFAKPDGFEPRLQRHVGRVERR